MTLPSFAELVAVEDANIDLEQACLSIGLQSAIQPYVNALNSIAERVALCLKDSDPIEVTVQRIGEYLHYQEGFTINREEYYQVSNSYLSQVIETRKGIPITLAIIHLCIAKRLGIEAVGINFPGHFLIQYNNSIDLLVEPGSGRFLNTADCSDMLRDIRGTEVPLEQHFFSRASSGEILTRVLENLKQIHLQGSNWEDAKECLRNQLAINPQRFDLMLQLGNLFQRQGDLGQALQLYSQVVAQSQNPALVKYTQTLLEQLGNAGPTVH